MTHDMPQLKLYLNIQPKKKKVKFDFFFFFLLNKLNLSLKYAMRQPESDLIFDFKLPIFSSPTCYVEGCNQCVYLIRGVKR